ncbi:hypothetical protein PLESTB_001591400 [Pleodorina starrii]|uniref:Uncharacterized protein n=1 Tax=Pleodorina starrii TaxID=330485 RepID=A0A9W6F949_9CHLO|nr:hypothetical protein PLESTB_001591400 [Pleodorina starrii]
MAGEGADSAVDGAVPAAAEQRAAQREARLREALQEERQRAVELEAELEKQLAEVVKAQEKAERRKQRLASNEREHQLATARLTEDKSRLEARERELGEELTRVRQALHGTRMDLDKARAAVYERDDAVMRLKREVAMQRARAGGSAALQPREMAELLGERKEDWQAVYSMKVEELRRAQEVAAELRTEVARGKTDAEARVAAERLAGAERVKSVSKERDEVKRELMELEYKLHEAQRRLTDLQSAAPPRHPGGTAPAAAAAAVGPAAAAGATGRTAGAPPTGGIASLRPPPHKSAPQHPQPQRPLATPGGGGGGRGSVVVVDARDITAAAAAATVDDDDDDGDLTALALEAIGGSEEEEEEGAGEGLDCGRRNLEAKEAELEGDEERGGRDDSSRGALEPGGSSGVVLTASVYGVGGGPDDDDLAEDSTPYNVATALDAAPPSSKRRRQDDGGGGGGDTQMYDSGGLIDDEDDEPVPVLPRAFSGLFSGGGGRAARPPPERGSAPGCSLSGPGGAGTSRAAGTGAYGMSFASKADAPRWGQGRGGGGGGSLIGEGPDGRGGTARFPLTSSFAHNTGARKAPPGKAISGRGGGRGGSGSGAPQGRIDAFLRPIAQPNPNRR